MHCLVGLGSEANWSLRLPMSYCLDGGRTSIETKCIRGEQSRSPGMTKTRKSLCVKAWTAAKFKELVKDYRDVADCLVVYIAEAHSTDGWAFTNNVDIKPARWSIRAVQDLGDTSLSEVRSFLEKMK
ncbi:unnamed protein product [Lota lota]